MKYRKKPTVVEAIQFDGHNHEELRKWSGGKVVSAKPWKENYGTLEVKTPEGVEDAGVFWWIVKGVNGEFYPCKPDIFEQTYEKVED